MDVVSKFTLAKFDMNFYVLSILTVTVKHLELPTEAGDEEDAEDDEDDPTVDVDTLCWLFRIMKTVLLLF